MLSRELKNNLEPSTSHWFISDNKMKGSGRLKDSWRFRGFVIWYISCILQQTLLELVAVWQLVTWKQDQESDFVLSKAMQSPSQEIRKCSFWHVQPNSKNSDNRLDHRPTLEDPNLPKICQVSRSTLQQCSKRVVPSSLSSPINIG